MLINVMDYCVCSQLNPIVQVQLLKDIADIVAHGDLTKIELLPNLAIAVAF